MKPNSNKSFQARNLGVLHNKKIFKNYNAAQVDNPWFCGLANTFLNSVDYFNTSDQKLFRKFRKFREIADFKSKIINTSQKIFPTEKLDCGWIDYPNLEYPDKVTGVGLRRIRYLRSNCPFGQKMPFKLESLPESLSSNCNLLTNNLKTKKIKESFVPALPRWVGFRPDISVREPTGSEKLKKRPIPNQLDCHVNIPYTVDFFNKRRNFETSNFLIHELLKPHKMYLSEGDYSSAKYATLHNFRLIKRNCSCPSCQKGSHGRTIVDATTNWLGFTNKEIGSEKLIEIISLFTGNSNYQEYYKIEEPSKAIIVKEIPSCSNLIIGINGCPVSHVIDDFTILSEIRSKSPFHTNPEYKREGRTVVHVSPTCKKYIPLSWKEQIIMKDIHTLYGHANDIQYKHEMNQRTTVANATDAFSSKKYLPKNSEFSGRSILEGRDWFSFCKLTRSLVRSTPALTKLMDQETFNLFKLMMKENVSSKDINPIYLKHLDIGKR